MNDFFAMLYESVCYIDYHQFSQNMYYSGAYVSTGLVMVLSSLLLELFYYFFLSSYGSFSKKIYWFLWMALIAAVNFCVAYSFCFSAIHPDAAFLEYFTFSMVNVFWTMVFCFLFSIAFKFKSIRASRTPF